MSEQTTDQIPEWKKKLLAEEAVIRAEIEPRYGQCWNTEELQREFTVHSFLAPFVSVTRKSDGVKGTMIFEHSPRIYYSFAKDE